MDGALIERARSGDADAFDEIARQRIDWVYRTALGILGNSADARDATQETLVSAWRSLRTLRDPDRFDAWLQRITVNAARMVARKRRGLREIQLTVDSDDRSPASSIHIGATDFDRAFERLSVDQRALLLSHHLDGRSISEIALNLGIPEGTVKSRLHAARRSLERLLGGPTK
jgi:RNA polymerase sigma-70 factor, ECF subfamily